ncbi:MAG TPA: superoxide dismutase [Dongiaceae bacterium]|nr:superoxide dismutase [Dongiaceae bacterium]
MFSVPALPYDYDALEDVISADIMRLHHDKHHQAYVDKLNAALEGHDDLKGKTVESLLRSLNSLPEAIRTTVKNNGGGHYNHCLFWLWMQPAKGEGENLPGGELEQAIVAKYGSFQNFVDAFTAKALGVFGSGWVFLQPDMEIITTANQDSPLMTGGEEPLLGLDVWEHAYYLDYQNRRPEYVKAWWNVVNWETVRQRFEANSR